MLLNICFSAHARRQLIERNITEEQVIETVVSPGQTPHLEGELFIFQKLFMVDMKQYLFRVVARKDQTGWFIVTAYKTSKISKYWRENP